MSEAVPPGAAAAAKAAPARSVRALSARAVVVLSIVLLGAAFGVDAAFVRPRLKEVRALTATVRELKEQVATTGSASGDLVALQQLAGVHSIGGAAGVYDNPVGYLGDALAAAGLQRLELSTPGDGRPATIGKLRKQGFFLRAIGSYPRIVRFARMLESGPGLIGIDAMTIVPVVDSDLLEARIALSVYGPQTGRP